MITVTFQCTTAAQIQAVISAAKAFQDPILGANTQAPVSVADVPAAPSVTLPPVRIHGNQRLNKAAKAGFSASTVKPASGPTEKEIIEDMEAAKKELADKAGYDSQELNDVEEEAPEVIYQTMDDLKNFVNLQVTPVVPIPGILKYMKDIFDITRLTDLPEGKVHEFCSNAKVYFKLDELWDQRNQAATEEA